MLLRDFYTKHLDINEKSDEELIAISVYYPPAFSKLVAKYQDAFLRKVQPVVRSREAAEDIVQEAFTKIYLNAKKFEKREGAQFSSWGYKILLNTAFTHYQKQKKTQCVELTSEMINQLTEYSQDEMLIMETSDRVVSILMKLPKHARSVLVLHFLEGRTHKEIAEQEGVAVGTIKTRVHRAKKAFRDLSIKFI
ncbi:RNA polymerase sigma factor [Patescibacteria group bacterium]